MFTVGVPKTLCCSSLLLRVKVVLLDTKADDCFSLAILSFVLVAVSAALDDVPQVYAKVPTVSGMKVFGARAYVHGPN